MNLQLFGGRGSGSGMGGGHQDGNDYRIHEGASTYSKSSLMSAASKAEFVPQRDGSWRIAVDAGTGNETATSYRISESVRVYPPFNPNSPLARDHQYRVSGTTAGPAGFFDTKSEAFDAARSVLRDTLGRTYDLRTNNRKIRGNR